ncbi:MAG TPA: DUF309 domain-containing protein [Blastocatellia bacterium]|nr:DUF309 domain-containing protein [Blastocatellia bacterium]
MLNESFKLQYLRGIELFNAQKFFECHEVLEGIWLASSGDERTLFHALIQCAAALYHLQNSNPKGALSVYRRAQQKLEKLPPYLLGLETHDFTNGMAKFFDTVLTSTGSNDWPQIHLQRTI